jgi:hypothetical protein
MFRKPHEVTEGELLRDALRHKDTKVAVISPDGRVWTFCNDTAADCSIHTTGISVTETKDKQDVLTDFRVRAKNGRLG